MKRVLALLCAVAMFGFILNPSYVDAATVNPKTLLEEKFPRERLTVSKSVDLNGDNKKEHMLITDSGNFYLINSKGVIVLVDTNYYSDEEPTIHILNISAKEKHVAVTLDYLPSNTELLVYKFQNGTLKKKLSVMGDVGINISKTGEINQLWKSHYPEGGWEIAVAN